MTRVADRSAAASVPARVTLVSFRLTGELFALPVEQVQEILDPLPVTRVPRAEPFAPGLVNVRGSVVPVVDLHRRLGLPTVGASGESRLVVLDLEIAETSTKVAFLADGVEQVLEIEGSAIEPVPDIGLSFAPRYLSGIAQRDGDLMILLRPDTVFEPPAPATA